MSSNRFKNVIQAIWLLPLSYIGINQKHALSPFLINVIIGPLWETFVFVFILFGLPLNIVRQSWDVPWLPDPVFDRILKWAIIIISFFISNFVFMTFHRPGHFGTLFLEMKAKKMLLKMEGAWIWKNFDAAKIYAFELLQIAEEWWIREGSEYSKFLQALSLYVLLSTGSHSYEQEQRMNQILSEVRIFQNEILLK